MEKIKIANQTFLYPMPMSVVGTVLDGKVNYMAAAWISRINADPARIGAALGKHHVTNRAIREHGEFGLGLPSLDLIREVDYVGLVSGAKIDKSGIFEAFFGKLKHATMARSCPLTMECRLVQVVDQPSNEFFIGEIAGVYCEEEFLTDGQPDIEKMRTYTLTMPDNCYWSVGGFGGEGLEHRPGVQGLGEALVQARNCSGGGNPPRRS